jgi:hypothetical protein
VEAAEGEERKREQSSYDEEESVDPTLPISSHIINPRSNGKAPAHALAGDFSCDDLAELRLPEERLALDQEMRLKSIIPFDHMLTVRVAEREAGIASNTRR